MKTKPYTVSPNQTPHHDRKCIFCRWWFNKAETTEENGNICQRCMEFGEIEG